MLHATKTPNAVRLRTAPAHPVPARTFRVFPESTGSATGTHVRIWCAAAPRDTKLRKQLDESRSGKVIVQDLIRLNTEAEPSSFDLTLEKGGGYKFQLDEFKVGTGFTGGYEDDPRAAPSETLKSSRYSTLYVAQPLTMQVGCGQDIATLKLFVHDATVIQTDLAVHGETTPRVDVSPSAPAKAKMAAEDATFRAAVAALAGQTAATLIGDLGAALDAMLSTIAAHIGLSSRHHRNDTVNTLAASFYGATTVAGRAASLSEMRKLLGRHMRNDSGAGPGSAGFDDGGFAGAAYHSTADWTNLLIDAATPAGALEDGIAQADLWRAYEAHRLSAVHLHTDSTNVLAPLSPLLNVHRYFLASLAALTASAPTSSTAAGLLISQLGFKDA
jgi:hypothetical protein